MRSPSTLRHFRCIFKRQPGEVRVYRCVLWYGDNFGALGSLHERMTVATMGLTNSPPFFQHRMENLLSPYLWSFVLVYVDDVIIFSRTKEAHLEHLDQVFELLEQSGISLNLAKCHFAYPDVRLLGHHVSRLGISTQEDKSRSFRAGIGR